MGPQILAQSEKLPSGLRLVQDHILCKVRETDTVKEVAIRSRSLAQGQRSWYWVMEAATGSQTGIVVQ